MDTENAGRGGAEGTRTPDPLIANEVLSQLSYSPVPQGADNAQRPWRKSSGARRSCTGRLSLRAERSNPHPVCTAMEIAAHASGLTQSRFAPRNDRHPIA